MKENNPILDKSYAFALAISSLGFAASPWIIGTLKAAD